MSFTYLVQEIIVFDLDYWVLPEVLGVKNLNAAKIMVMSLKAHM